MTSEEMKELIIKFEDFLCQKTFHETEIYVNSLKACNYYRVCHREDSGKSDMLFAFIAGYLSAELDAKRSNSRQKDD
jgi:hypothetical protein